MLTGVSERSTPPGDAPGIITWNELRATPDHARTFVDVRNRWQFARSHATGAIRLSWLAYRDGRGRTGKLPADLLALQRELGRRGIRHGNQIVVYGNAARGWGEDGRIAWMLRYLGFGDVRVLDGGWRDEDATIETKEEKRTAESDFVIQTALRADIEDVQRAIDSRTGGNSDTLLIDTRSLEEFNGSRRYWPKRTGRVPGALHLHWRALLDADGRLDRSPELMHRLASRGMTPHRSIITYCVGGVRSAHTLVMLGALGFHAVRNYDGSWYEWAADRSRPVEQGAKAQHSGTESR